MLCINKLSVIVFSLILSVTSFAAAGTGEEFKSIVNQGDVSAAEAYLKRVDEAVIKSDYQDNNDLRAVFGLFETTHPAFVEFANAWAKKFPDSIYQKTALAWQLNHLAWITRGSEYAHYTHPDAFEQMHNYLDTSSELAWEVFKERNDFVPASDLIATHYLHNRGLWSFEDFVDVAMKANSSQKLLNNIVYVYNPKWQGDWDAVKRVCEKYAPMIVLKDGSGYPVEHCRVNAVYNSAGIYEGRDTAMLSWAQAVIDAAPKNVLTWARSRDLYHIQRQIPENQADAIALFDPTHNEARKHAWVIEHFYQVPDFKKNNLAKIADAEYARAKADPLNPDYLAAIRYIHFSAQPKSETNPQRATKEALEGYIEKLETLLTYGQYRPEVWQGLADMKQELSGGGLNAESVMAIHEKAVIVSNYHPKSVKRYFNSLSISYFNLQRRLERPDLFTDTPEIDAKLMISKILCPTIQTARLLNVLCEPGGVQARSCQAEFTVNDPSEFIEKAKEGNLCPQKLNAKIEDLLYEQKPNL